MFLIPQQIAELKQWREKNPSKVNLDYRTCLSRTVTTAGCKPNTAAGSPHLNKENEVLEGGVEVGLLLQLHH